MWMPGRETSRCVIERPRKKAVAFDEGSQCQVDEAGDGQ